MPDHSRLDTSTRPAKLSHLLTTSSVQWGLLSLFSSPQAYVDALTSLQAKQLLWPFGNILPNAWYWAGNEPDILAPWQFGVAGNAYANLTQYWTRWLLHTYFTTKADGIPGNDDFGTSPCAK
jgi:putative alpha-1,2-mannosidase